MSASVLPRHVSGEIDAALGGARVILIHGARQTGKTTLARQVCDRLGGTFATLDDPALLAAARGDPVGFVEQPGPLVVDEIQRAGDPLVTAIKMAVDHDPSPGRFVITGSTNLSDRAPRCRNRWPGGWPSSDLWPFSAGELARGPAENFVSLAFDDPEALRAGPRGTPSRGPVLGDDLCRRLSGCGVADAGPATALVPRLCSHGRSARHRGACRHPSSRRRGPGAGDGCCVDRSGTERGSPGARRRRQRPHRRELPRLAPHRVLGAPSADVVPQLVHEGREIRQAVSRRYRPCSPPRQQGPDGASPPHRHFPSADSSRHSWPARWPSNSHGTTPGRNSATSETTAVPRSISSLRPPTGASWPSRPRPPCRPERTPSGGSLG